MAAQISVAIAEADDGWLATVTVRDGERATEHRVAVRPETYELLTGGAVTPKELVVASFAFLLEHEPQDAILKRFDLAVIGRYFQATSSI
ncbi:MAG: hypothetical protein WD359_07465 [Dehalococcoidia bacterium]